jgi:prepilin signal peptidase PulO-like enzyme (type II secretory pathway)
MKYALPFGTFLAAAALIASMTGERLLNWYSSFF